MFIRNFSGSVVVLSYPAFDSVVTVAHTLMTCESSIGGIKFLLQLIKMHKVIMVISLFVRFDSILINFVVILI